MLQFLIISILIVSIHIAGCYEFAIGKPGGQQAVFEKFDTKCGQRYLPMQFTLTGVHVERNRVFVNCTVTVKEDIKDDPKMTIQIHRCKNKENLDTCEKFHDFKLPSYCASIGTFAREFSKAFEPEWNCPIKKGVYRTNNAEADATAFFMFPVESWYWKLLVQILDKHTDRLLMCVLAEMQMKRI